MPDHDQWTEILQDIVEISQTVMQVLSCKASRRVDARFFNIFVLQSKHGLEAINMLYRNGLSETAQVLVRAVLEYKINFDFFLSKFLRDPQDIMTRMMDAMMLEKIKQLESVEFRGLELVPGAPPRNGIREIGREIELRRPSNEVRALRRFGFSGISVEQRARQTGHIDRYNVIYRNFSRNVHGSDYAEYLMRDLEINNVPRDDYVAIRNSVALSTSAFCGIGIVEPAARFFRVPILRRINAVKKRIEELDGN